MRGLTFVDVPLEVWTRLLSVVCLHILFSNTAYIFFMSYIFELLDFWIILLLDLLFQIFCIFELFNFWIFLLLDFTISNLLPIWTFQFLNNSFIGFYYFTSFGFLNFQILVFSLLSFLLSTFFYVYKWMLTLVIWNECTDLHLSHSEPSISPATY